MAVVCRAQVLTLASHVFASCQEPYRRLCSAAWLGLAGHDYSRRTPHNGLRTVYIAHARGRPIPPVMYLIRRSKALGLAHWVDATL